MIKLQLNIVNAKKIMACYVCRKRNPCISLQVRDSAYLFHRKHNPYLEHYILLRITACVFFFTYPNPYPTPEGTAIRTFSLHPRFPHLYYTYTYLSHIICIHFFLFLGLPLNFPFTSNGIFFITNYSCRFSPLHLATSNFTCYTVHNPHILFHN